VPPPGPEPVRKGDGSTGNGCGRNAGRRPVGDLRREHPHTGAAVAGDGLSSSGPHIRPLEEKGYRPMPGGRPGDHGPLSGWFGASETRETWERRGGDGTVHRSGWDRGLPPDDASPGLRASMPEYGETDGKGEIQGFPWVTGLPPGRDTVMSAMRCGRRRWAIGNGTFRTLKARDPYRSGHGSGHGHSHLADVLMTPAMPAFLTARARRHRCPPCGRARRPRKRGPCLWNRPRGLSRTFVIPDWRALYRAMSGQMGKPGPSGMLPDGP